MGHPVPETNVPGKGKTYPSAPPRPEPRRNEPMTEVEAEAEAAVESESTMGFERNVEANSTETRLASDESDIDEDIRESVHTIQRQRTRKTALVFTAIAAGLVLMGLLVSLSYSSEPGTMKPGTGWQGKSEVNSHMPQQ